MNNFPGSFSNDVRRVVIMRGVSGAGKSTFVRKHFADAKVCSADSFFMRGGEYKFNPALLGKAHGACKNDFVSALNDDSVKTIVVDNTNTRNREMKFYIETALRNSDVTVYVVELTTPVGVAAGRNVHGVPREVVQNMRDRFENLAPKWVHHPRVHEVGF